MFGSTPLNLVPGQTPGLSFSSGTPYKVTSAAAPKLPALTSAPSVTPTIYAPKLDIAGINAQARKAAAGAVNPYYTKELSLFLARQGQLKKQQQAQYDTNVQNINDTLAQTIEANQTNRVRTGEDVAQNLGEINQQADVAQTDQGTQFANDRLDLAAATAGSGGLGAQKQEGLQEATNVAEQRQAQTFAQEKTKQEQFKGRTLEDLMKSDTQATTGATKGKKQAKFDLDSYIKAQDYETTSTKRGLEKSRRGELASEEARQRSLRVLKFIEGIANPASKAAAYSTYAAYI